MKVSKLIADLNEYLDMYGDQNVTVHYDNSGEDVEIIRLDAFKYEFGITVGDFEEEENDSN